MANQTPSTTPQELFRQRVESMATDVMTQVADPEQVARSVGRLAVALRKAASANDAIYGCSPKSVAHCVAMSALTGLFPGGVKPDVYLIPRAGQLEWQVSVRGLQTLACRAGWLSVVAVPVHIDDEYRVTQGTDRRIEHVPSGKWPSTLSELAGMYVDATHQSGHRVLVDVPIGVIEKRRSVSKSGAVWKSWEVEMAQKTAVGWAISRGYLGALEAQPEMQALSALDQDRQPVQDAQRGTFRRPEQPPKALAYTIDADAAGDALGLDVEVSDAE